MANRHQLFLTVSTKAMKVPTQIDTTGTMKMKRDVMQRF